MAKASSPTRSTSRGGMVALVSTEVTSPQSSAARAGPTSMGERRSRTLRRVPSTQATSPSLRVPRRCRSSARCAGGLQGARLAAGRGRGRALRSPPSSARKRALRPAAAQRVGARGRLISAGTGEQLGQLAVVDRRPGLVVQDPGPDPVGRGASPSWSPSDGQRVEQVGVALGRRASGPSVTSARNRPGVTSTPRLDVMTSSSSWASSKTTTSCSGSTTPPLARWAP